MTRTIDTKILNEIDSELERIKGISKMAYTNIKPQSVSIIKAYQNDKKITDDYFNTFVKELKGADEERISDFNSNWAEYRAAFFIWPSQFKSLGRLPSHYIEKYSKK